MIFKRVKFRKHNTNVSLTKGRYFLAKQFRFKRFYKTDLMNEYAKIEVPMALNGDRMIF